MKKPACDQNGRLKKEKEEEEKGKEKNWKTFHHLNS
jgi:hypothetical protein